MEKHPTSLSKWDERFLGLAREVSTWSKDPSTKVGAVIANGKSIVSCGFNGFPPSIPDNEEWLNDRETKYKLVVHAEVNAILNSSINLHGATIYTTPLCPCGECAKLIVGAGIRRVVSLSNENPRWITTEAEFVFDKAGIEYLWLQ